MNRNHHALILATAKGGTIEGLVDLSPVGSTVKFKKLVSRTCSDLKRRGLKVQVRASQRKCSHAAGRRTA